MPCRYCHKGERNGIGYCYDRECGCCNKCHVGWTCPTDPKLSHPIGWRPKWWKQKGDPNPKPQEIFMPGQSHGGLSYPELKNFKAQPQPQVKAQQFQCDVNGCLENHKNHHCRRCGNQDSKHKSADCPEPKYRCKALKSGCTERHEHHMCKHCKDHDADHKSDNCLQKICKHCSCERGLHFIADSGIFCRNGKNTKFE